MMERLLTLAFLAQALRISVPYTLAALGGTVSERSGVVNLALEGMLLVGAFTATLGSHGGGVAAGLLCGVAGGIAVAALHAVAVLHFRADAIVSGVALNLLVYGLTRFFLKAVFQSSSSSPDVPGFDHVGWGAAFVVAAALAAVSMHVWLERTRGGLRLRATGENPHAADSLGVNVIWTRWKALLWSGALAGLGGAWLALDNRGFVDEMSGGRGYIALAAVIFGKWRPLGAVAACLLFGFADALQLNLQAIATGVPRELVQILPYVLTILALAGLVGRSRAPAALGVAFERR